MEKKLVRVQGTVQLFGVDTNTYTVQTEVMIYIRKNNLLNYVIIWFWNLSAIDKQTMASTEKDIKDIATPFLLLLFNFAVVIVKQCWSGIAMRFCTFSPRRPLNPHLFHLTFQ